MVKIEAHFSKEAIVNRIWEEPPDPKEFLRGVEDRTKEAVAFLAEANKGPNAERTGACAKTLGRRNNR